MISGAREKAEIIRYDADHLVVVSESGGERSIAYSDIDSLSKRKVSGRKTAMLVVGIVGGVLLIAGLEGAGAAAILNDATP